MTLSVASESVKGGRAVTVGTGEMGEAVTAGTGGMGEALSQKGRCAVGRVVRITPAGSGCLNI